MVIRQQVANPMTGTPLVQKVSGQAGTQTVVVTGGQVLSPGQIVVSGNTATQVMFVPHFH